MLLYPLIRAARIVSACSIVNPEYQFPVTTLAEVLSSAVPLLNAKLPFTSYITPLMCDPLQTIYLTYSHNRQKYEVIELFSLLSLLFLYYYK
tara:strand:+ start:333 stop:608 length:276 start_codon:yes stop_codon:yes gene_type:complete